MRPDPAGTSATALLAGFASASLSPVAVSEALLDVARAAESRYRHIVSLDSAGVRAAAQGSEDRWRQGRPRPLEGLPFALKGMIPPDGELVRRVTEAGAYVQCVVVPSGYGTPVCYAAGTQPLNPVDIERMPGGSSTGSAIALAAGHVPLAIGSDAAGSIRIPGACCEVLGFKPTRGILPKAGGMGLSATLGEAGPMARCVADLALLFRAMGGPEAGEPETSLRLAVALDDEVEGVFATTLGTFEETGIAIGRSPLPLLAEARAAGWTVLCYEAAAAMAPHLDAIRRSPTTFLKYADRGRHIGRDEYRAALVAGERFARSVDAALTTVDALVTPCAPFALPRADDPDLASKTPRMGEMFLPFSLSGHSALVLPLRHADGTVTSVQLVGRRGGDAALLALAEKVEDLATARG